MNIAAGESGGLTRKVCGDPSTNAAWAARALTR